MFFKKNLNNKSRFSDQKGFSFIELLLVMAIIGILASLGMTYFTDFLKTTRDTTAMNDAQNLMIVVYNNFLIKDSVDYTKTEFTGSGLKIGIQTANAPIVARPPAFTFSPNVRISFDGADENKSFDDGRPGSFHAWIYHSVGSAEHPAFAGTCSGTNGRKCVECYVDEGDSISALIIW